MRGEKIQYGNQRCGILCARAELFGIKAGQREQTCGAANVAKRPAQRTQRKDGRVVICRCVAHCLCVRTLEGTESVAKRVLVVEDNELNLKLFCDLLRAHAFVTEGVRDGREAVARARSFQPHMIVMDIQMPHVTGYELIAQLKADPGLRAIPVMAVTAYASRDDEDRIRAVGADAYVSKPIVLARFIDQVRQLLALVEEGESFGGDAAESAHGDETGPSVQPEDPGASSGIDD